MEEKTKDLSEYAVEKKIGIYKALVECQKTITSAGMSGENKYDHYKYSNAPDIIKAIKPSLEANGLAISFNQDPSKTFRCERKTSQDKTEQFVSVVVTATLYHESGEALDFVGQGDGQDRGDKAIYKALTGAQKYLLRLIFNLPCMDDPEDDKGKKPDDMDQRPPATGKAPKSPAKYPASKPAPEQRVTEPTPQTAPANGFKPPSDAEQEKAGKISNAQVEMIVKLYKQKNIPKDNLADWLGLQFALPIGSRTPWGIPKDKFNMVCNVILKTPEEITGKKDETPPSA